MPRPERLIQHDRSLFFRIIVFLSSFQVCLLFCSVIITIIWPYGLFIIARKIKANFIFNKVSPFKKLKMIHLSNIFYLFKILKKAKVHLVFLFFLSRSYKFVNSIIRLFKRYTYKKYEKIFPKWENKITSWRFIERFSKCARPFYFSKIRMQAREIKLN